LQPKFPHANFNAENYQLPAIGYSIHSAAYKSKNMCKAVKTKIYLLTIQPLLADVVACRPPKLLAQTIGQFIA